jgi:hypothetical protein
MTKSIFSGAAMAALLFTFAPSSRATTVASYDSPDSYDYATTFPSTASELIGTFTFTIPAGNTVGGITISGSFGNGDSPTTALSHYYLGFAGDEEAVEVAACDSISANCYSGQEGPYTWTATLTPTQIATLAPALAAGSIDFSFTWDASPPAQAIPDILSATGYDEQYVYAGTATLNLALQTAQTISFTTSPPPSAAYNSQFTVVANGGGSGIALVFTNGGGCSNNGATYTMTSGTTACSVIVNQAGNTTYSAAPQVTVSVTATKLTPSLTWTTPVAINYGSALSSVQLDATASVAGAFAYTPAAGTVLAAGAGQVLSVLFTPTDTADYTNANGGTTITVNPAPSGPANLVITKVLSRSSGNVQAVLTIANTGGTAAAKVVVSSVTIGGVAATPLPQSLGTIAAGSSAQATVSVPGTVGSSGAASSLSVTGTYTGGSFSSNSRITLP